MKFPATSNLNDAVVVAVQHGRAPFTCCIKDRHAQYLSELPGRCFCGAVELRAHVSQATPPPSPPVSRNGMLNKALEHGKRYGWTPQWVNEP